MIFSDSHIKFLGNMLSVLLIAILKRANLQNAGISSNCNSLRVYFVIFKLYTGTINALIIIINIALNFATMMNKKAYKEPPV